MRYLIDTDISSYVTKKNLQVSTRLRKTPQWAISVVTKYELLKGVLYRGEGTWSQATREFLELATIMPFDREAAIEAAKISTYLKSIGRPSGLADELIAGHAVSLGMTLVTNHVKHFEGVPGLKVESWL